MTRLLPLLSGQAYADQLELLTMGVLWTQANGLVTRRGDETLETRRLVAVLGKLVCAIQCRTAVAVGASLSAQPIEDVRCPWCHAAVKWSCGVKLRERGTVDCQDGTNVSRRMSADGHIAGFGGPPPCHWPGATCRRVRNDAEPGAIVIVTDLAFDRAETLGRCASDGKVKRLLQEMGIR